MLIILLAVTARRG